MRNVILMGPPGSGKGTQAVRLAETHGFMHVATGDLLRGAVRSGNELGKKVGATLTAGEFVPDDLMMDLIRETMADVPEDCFGWLMDGFPRTAPQAEGLVDILRDGDIAEPLIIEVKVPDNELVDRLSGRVTCSNCDHVYAKDDGAAGEACLHCGEELYVRSDDKPETVRSRLVLFHERTEPARKVLASHWRVVEVDGIGSQDEVTQRIIGVLEAKH